MFNLQRSILNTIIFFDLFDYPLTLLEIQKYLDVKCDLVELEKELSALDKIQIKNGFYFLSSREKIIKTKMARYNYADRKFKRALFIAQILKFIPWIKMIAIGNLIGAHNLKDDGDIDFFIITEEKKLWLSRFFAVTLIKILGLRPSARNQKDKICLSFFISENAPSLENLMLKNKDQEPQDLYFIYWLAGLAPIYNQNKTYEKFIEKNNWIKNILPNWQPAELVDRRFIKNGANKFLDLLFGRQENFFKKLQFKILPRNLKENQNKNTNVVINDQIFKAHLNDRRQEFMKKFADKLG
jgi:hypothetical protein